MRTAFLFASGLLGAAIASPTYAQDAGQPIVLHCVHNENEALDVVIDLGRNTYSKQMTLTNFNGPGSTFTAPPDKGPLQSVSAEQVEFTDEGEPFTLDRYTGMLSSPKFGSFKCERVQKVF